MDFAKSLALQAVMVASPANLLAQADTNAQSGWLQFFRNATWQSIGAIAGIVAVLLATVAIITAIRQSRRQRKKVLKWAVDSAPIVSVHCAVYNLRQNRQ